MKTLALAFAVLAASPLSAVTAQELPRGYTCCNLRYDKDWISDANWASLPMIPAGTPIRVISYGSNRAAVEIDGKPMRIGHDYGRADEPLEKYIAKLVVKANPRARIDRYPEKVRAAIHAGKVVPGMNREQVIIAVGFPPTHQTKTLDSRLWNHWQSRTGRYEIHWSGKGTVEKVVGLR